MSTAARKGMRRAGGVHAPESIEVGHAVISMELPLRVVQKKGTLVKLGYGVLVRTEDCKILYTKLD